MTPPVRFTPLGGLSEVGMNCALLSCGDTRIVIDCGIGFTNEAGAETVHPDFGHLLEQHGEAGEIDAIVITHGHEDHIGALPHLLRELDAPVYAPAYAAALIADRFSETPDTKLDLRPSPAGARHSFGPIELERFAVHHSIADATGLVFHTPVGAIVHTGDFKIEATPSEGQRFDRDRLSEIAEQGVRLLLSDSTGAEVEGRSGLERDAGIALREVVANAKQRIVVATFSSNFFRVRAALRLARDHGRKVCLLGRSVMRHTRVAQELDLLPSLDSLLIAPEDVHSFPPEQVMIIAGGTQGERRSALTRLARAEHHSIRLAEGDTVVFSSRIIPGNELAALDVIDRLQRQRIEVVTWRTEPGVHASGHGAREEQREMIRLVRPESFVPIHGTYSLRNAHAQLAREEGLDDVRLIQNGSILELTEHRMSVVGSVPVGQVYLEGDEALDATIVEERRWMASGGLLNLVIGVEGGRVHELPAIDSRGVFNPEAREQAHERLARHLRGQFQKRRFTSHEQAEEPARKAAAWFLRHHYSKRPLLTVVTYECR